MKFKNSRNFYFQIPELFQISGPAWTLYICIHIVRMKTVGRQTTKNSFSYRLASEFTHKHKNKAELKQTHISHSQIFLCALKMNNYPRSQKGHKKSHSS